MMDALLIPRLALRRYGPEVAGHRHDHGQWLFAIEGRLDMEVEGRAVRVDRSTGFALPAGAWHAFEAPRGARCVVLDAPDLVAEQPHALAVPEAVQRLAAAWRRAPAGPIGDPQLAARLWLALAPAVRVRPRRELSLIAVEALAAARPDLDLPALAAHFGLSPSQFHARFKSLAGESPQRHLRRLRLAHARRLLAAGTPVAAAAARCGYASPSAFTAALKREGL